MRGDWKERLTAVSHGRFHLSEPMSKHCSFKIGGPAELFFIPASPSDLIAAVDFTRLEKVPRFVVGNGTNLLVGDKGIEGVVLKLGKGFDRLRLEEAGGPDGPVIVEAGAAVTLARLRTFASRKGFIGTEFLYGIPGTIGGAIMCNAGTRLGEMKDITVDVEVVGPDGTVRRIGVADAGFSYRRCSLPEGWIVSGARLRLKAGGADAAMSDLEDLKEHRAGTQPWGLPSAGSVFRNPTGDRAGRLIDAAGLKGLSLGGAEVSTVHANFIVNRGGATAESVKRLIEIVQAEVERRHGIRLEPEIRLVGEF